MGTQSTWGVTIQLWLRSDLGEIGRQR